MPSGPPGGHFRVYLGSLWEPLGSLGEPLGALWESMGDPWEYFGITLVVPGWPWAAFFSILVPFVAPRVIK